MSAEQKFSFGNESVAKAYDNILVPVLFDPWAKQLIEEFAPWSGMSVVDLATGTGILAHNLQYKIGDGSIIAIDINHQMLEIAKQRCNDGKSKITFVESSVEDLNISDNSIDVVLCQQGFQFFPNKLNAAKEIRRILKPEGRIVVSTWQSVEECQIFGAICKALEKIGEPNISDMMQLPFDYMPVKDLAAPFRAAGFENIEIKEQQMDLRLPMGLSQAIEFAYATPIGPKLIALSKDKNKAFKNNLITKITEISSDEANFGSMKTNILTANK